MSIMRNIFPGCEPRAMLGYHAFQLCDGFVVMAHGRRVRSVARPDTSLDELTDLIMTH